MKLLGILTALVILALSVSIADAGPLRDRRAQRRADRHPLYVQPREVPGTAVPLTYQPGVPMPSPEQFGIRLPSDQPGCVGGSCGVQRGFRR